MHRWTWLAGVLGLVAAAGAAGPEPGRTDGPEGGEYGTGGYRYFGSGGGFYLEGLFGSAQVDVEVPNADNTSKTDLIVGVTGGRQLEEWLAFQLGFGHISDQKINLFTAGMRNTYDAEPFGYHLSLDAEIYSPNEGDTRFAIVPGAGGELVLSERLRVGLGYQHDFVFSDDNIDIDRFTARIQFQF